jgi:hypothetical protein
MKQGNEKKTPGYLNRGTHAGMKPAFVEAFEHNEGSAKAQCLAGGADSGTLAIAVSVAC